MTSPVARRARLEIACFTPESAIKAAEFGADRIELCADKNVGGVTPCKWIDVELEISRNSQFTNMVYCPSISNQAILAKMVRIQSRCGFLSLLNPAH